MSESKPPLRRDWRDDPQWVTFLYRVAGPKLAFVRREMDRAGIKNRMNGPLLEIMTDQVTPAWVLWESFDGPTRYSFDAVRNDDLRFSKGA